MWTPQREEAFTKAKQAVYDCQKLFFLDEKATPILQLMRQIMLLGVCYIR